MQGGTQEMVACNVKLVPMGYCYLQIQKVDLEAVPTVSYHWEERIGKTDLLITQYK